MANPGTGERLVRHATDHISAAGALALGFRLIFRPGIRLFALAPIAINTLVIAAVAFYTGTRFHDLLRAWVPALPAWLHWLQYVAWILFSVGFLLAAAYVFTLLANLIAAPFNGLLAERVERFLGGASPEDEPGFWRALPRDLAACMRVLWYTLSRAVMLGIISLILLWMPGLNALIPLLWMYFGAYMLAFEYLDVPMSNHGMRFADKKRWLRRHHTQGLLFGGTVTLATMVPGLNLLVMPAAVAGATAFWVNQESQAHTPAERE